MPFQSQNQARAMFAAKSGNSTLGIPKSVGSDFVNASQGMKVGALPIQKPRPSSSLEAMTGIPSGKKPVRRGGGRMKKKAANPQTHLSNLKSAMASGNHQQAKIHALSLANALHTLTKPAGAPSSPQMPDTDNDGY
jgi:hypothetical protein